ncbi:MAG: alpha/beta fold hydrolase [Burkholderiaceae bacterium]
MPAVPAATTLGRGATALFLLHGVGGGKETWQANQSSWADAGYQTLAWDAPGYGASAPRYPCSMSSMARALEQLIEQTGAATNVLIGHSMGGMVAQQAAALFPEKIHGLVLSATSPSFGPPGSGWQQNFLRDRFAPLDAGLGMAALARQLVPAMMAPGIDVSRQRPAAALMAGVPEGTYRAALAAIVEFNQRENLPQIGVPTFCLAGEHDRNAPPSVLRKMGERIPGARYACIPGVGHLANLEAPAAFNALVLEFLYQHFPVRGDIA